MKQRHHEATETKMKKKTDEHKGGNTITSKQAGRDNKVAFQGAGAITF